MIYVCINCGKVIPELNTPGDEVNKNFLCPSCAKEVNEDLKKHKAAMADFLNTAQITY